MATLEIAGALTRAGARALVLSEGGRLAELVGKAGGEVVTFPAAAKNPFRMGANVRAITRFIRAEGVDLIHARSRAPAWSALAAARVAAIPFVTTYHGTYGTEFPFKNAYNSVMARGDRVIANSHFTANLISTRHGIRGDRLAVIHRGVDLERFDPSNIAVARIFALRRSWGVEADAKIILHAARLTGWKGQRTVIAAASRLRASGGLTNAVVILAGDAQGREAYADDLQTLIDGHDLDGKVRLVGHCDDMAAAFATAHAAVVASTEPEAFGRAAAEAQAMRCPVVATDLGAARETVLGFSHVPANKATGWLVRSGDPAVLSGALSQVLGLSPPARVKMGKRARTHIQANFSLERMARATLAIYDELLGSGLAHSFSEPLDTK